MADRSAILFLTHLFSEEMLQRYLSLQRSVLDRFDVYLSLDVTDPKVKSSWEEALAQYGYSETLLCTTAPQLEQQLGYACLQQGQVVPGSAHYPLIHFYQSHPCAYYWVVEYDVWLTRSWRDFFDAFDQSEADLICSHLTSYQNDPQWVWWKTLHVPNALMNQVREQKNQLKKGFFPLYRLSALAIKKVHEAHQQGWMGHFEVLIPVIAQQNQLEIADLNSFGDMYREGPLGPQDGPPPYASLRWRPEISHEELAQHQHKPFIFHPVKC